MLKSQKKLNFNCLNDYVLETLNTLNLERLDDSFNNLPADPYIAENYRFRRLSSFNIVNNQLVKLPHSPLFQSKKYNPLVGDVVRDYAELEQNLVELPDFQTIVREFFEFCQLCSDVNQIKANEISVHQIRTVANPQEVGYPAPEGIHRDGVTLVGIFSVSRHKIEGAATSLYKSKDQDPVFNKILNPGEFVIFSDRQLFHFTSVIKATTAEVGTRDVFVLTYPGLRPPKDWVQA
ncbi:2OG-Fe dioxygenase family protein [Pleurocapsa sp. PCC 7319]|uniref:2OG-Fe dioxygenase family protein n=1 Tax=Pleurocapsa sp. PCC 7319 TaxID=118161 RepID=UPI000345A0B0|nr:2OG-Fe dioxygenase family protein [Pleurocapsa sp. PCC 7319]